MKRAVVLFFLIGISVSALATSGIAIQTENSADMQVFINGKLFNKQPGKFVRIKSQSGLFHIEVKVKNPHNNRWYLVKKDVRVQNGIECFYKVTFSGDDEPQIKEIRRYPVYNKYLLNGSLYNKYPTG